MYVAIMIPYNFKALTAGLVSSVNFPGPEDDTFGSTTN